MTTAADEAYQSIRRMIVRGDLSPGQRMSQSRIARQLGCSTVPVVEAMRRLESEGLLTKVPRKMARLRSLTPREAADLYLVREGLEAVAARLCAERATDANISRLRQLARSFERAFDRGSSEAINASEVAIHTSIAEFAQCPLLVDELSRLMLIERTAGWTDGREKFEPHWRHSHRALIEAICHHDADAAEYLMKKHIHAGYLERLALLKDSHRRRKRTP